MATEIDRHVGQRLRRQRRLLGLTQSQLGDAVGIRFQQVQKYECGANRVTASRLYELAKALGVSVEYFFDGLGSTHDGSQSADMLSRQETWELVQAYYRLAEGPRRRLLDLARSLSTEPV